MKICITSTGNSNDAIADQRFGRCKYFAIYDDESKDFEFILNPGLSSQQGAGITSAQKIIDIGADAVVTGKVGPNAMRLLNAYGIKVYAYKGETVEEAFKLFNNKDLTEIITPGPSHSGMGNGHIHRGGRG